MLPTDLLLTRAKTLKLYGLIAYWDEMKNEPWLELFIKREEEERTARSLESRLKSARLGRFKTLDKFDWSWPTKCDRKMIERWMTIDFMGEDNKPNLILCGSNGVGKTTIATNLAYQAVLHGRSALFTTAAAMLNELAALDSDNALRRRLKYYVKPDLLVIDEIGYLSYSNRHADLLFEIISQRYEVKSTMITTNKPFGEWGDIFPSATCVVSIIDRLVHHSEIVNIEAESFRLKEAKEKLKANTKKGKLSIN
jgi:DNA replication protein DnaC